jgi:hypothetical protein
MIGIWLSALASKFEFEVPQISTILGHCEICEISHLQCFFRHSDKIFAGLSSRWTERTIEILYHSNADNSVGESEVLKLISELIQHGDFPLSKARSRYKEKVFS